MSFPSNGSCAFAEALEPRCLLTAFFQNTQISSLNDNAYGPTNFDAFENEALFQATNPRTGHQAIWITDGTSAGTKPLPISFTGSQLLVGVAGNRIYFAVASAQIQTSFDFSTGSFLKPVPAELYVTTNLGRSSKSLGRMPAGVGFGVSAAVGSEFFFSVSGLAEGTSDTLWETDATRAGTHVVNQVQPQGQINSLESIGDYLLVNTFSDDGSGAITSLNLSSFQTQRIAAADVRMPVLFDGYEYFTLNGDLTRTDGTTQGTVDLYAGTANMSDLPSLTQILPVGNDLYLFSDSELYICSGSVSTIVPVAPLPDYTGIQAATYDSQAVFTLTDDSGYSALYPYYSSSNTSFWHSDGTSSGTEMVILSQGSGDLVATGTNLYYATSDAHGGREGLDHDLPGQIYLLSKLPTNDSNLTLQFVNVSLSDNVVGSAIKGSIQLMVSNKGGVVSIGSETLAVYFATDLAGDGLSLAKTLRLNLRLPAGSSRSISVPLNHLPNQAPGEYYVFVQVIESGEVLAQATSAVPVVLTAGTALSNLSYSVLSDKTAIIRFEIADIANVPLAGTYQAFVTYVVTYGDSTTSEAITYNIDDPEIKLLARPKRQQQVRLRVPDPIYNGLTIQPGGTLTVDMAGIFAQTSITT